MFGFFHDNDNDDTVLVRVNGNGTEKFLDRNSEVSNNVCRKAGILLKMQLVCVFLSK